MKMVGEERGFVSPFATVHFSFLAVVVSTQSNIMQSLIGHWSLEVFITESPHVRQSGFWNPEISPMESGIQIFLWNQESVSLESRIPLTIGNRNPVPGIRNLKRGIQNPRLSWITLNGGQTAPH